MIFSFLGGREGPLGSRCQIGIRHARDKWEKRQRRILGERTEEDREGPLTMPDFWEGRAGRRLEKRACRAFICSQVLAWTDGASLSKAACSRSRTVGRKGLTPGPRVPRRWLAAAQQKHRRSMRATVDLKLWQLEAVCHLCFSRLEIWVWGPQGVTTFRVIYN